MKRQLLFSLLLLSLAFSASAQDSGKNIRDAAAAAKDLEIKQDSVHWRYTSLISVNFGQVALVNWSAGGQNSISIQLNAVGSLTYQKNHLLWDNQWNFMLGGVAQGRVRQPSGTNKYPFRKNVDLLQITSRAGYEIGKKKVWSATVLADFKTSLFDGFDYSEYDAGTSTGRQEISTPFSPSFLTLSLGINYKPAKFFSLYISPAAAKLSIMTPGSLLTGADTSVNAKLNKVDQTRYGLTAGSSFRAEVGAYIRADFQKDVWKNINIKTSLELFENYNEKHKLDALVAGEITAIEALPGYATTPGYQADVADLNKHLYYDNRTNIDVNWFTSITFKVNKFITASLETQLIYDHDTEVPHLRPDGSTYLGRGTQFREAFTLGFGYKFK